MLFIPYMLGVDIPKSKSVMNLTSSALRDSTTRVTLSPRGLPGRLPAAQPVDDDIDIKICAILPPICARHAECAVTAVRHAAVTRKCHSQVSIAVCCTPLCTLYSLQRTVSHSCLFTPHIPNLSAYCVCRICSPPHPAICASNRIYYAMQEPSRRKTPVQLRY